MIQSSELILNPDGSVYHLNIKPENLASNILFVGDPDRVEKITKWFDSIEFTSHKREFNIQTGIYKGKRITVISTGIGPDNIDIVMNELDALVNIDLKNRTIKTELTSLKIVRIGTSGALQPEIEVNSWVMSKYAIGLDNMLRSYLVDDFSNIEMENAFISQTNWDARKGRPYVVSSSDILAEKFESEAFIKGCTGTSGGFYGPQGRVLRLPIQDPELNSKMDQFEYNGIKMTNLEMETAAIYGLGKLMGHECLSLNAIIANRATGTFSEDPLKSVDELIKYVLNKIIN